MSDETYRVGFEADTSAIDRALETLTARASAFGTAMNGALRGAVSGGQSLDGVLRQLTLRLSTLALDAALKPVTNAAGGALNQLAGGIGQIFGAGAPAKVVPFAKGGVVASPSFFPNGRQMGLMGEAGAEAVLPLKRGSDGTLGVSLGGGGAGRGGAPTIVFNVSTPDAASFRRAETQVQAMLARAAGRGRRGL